MYERRCAHAQFSDDVFFGGHSLIVRGWTGFVVHSCCGQSDDTNVAAEFVSENTIVPSRLGSDPLRFFNRLRLLQYQELLRESS